MDQITMITISSQMCIYFHFLQSQNSFTWDMGCAQGKPSKQKKTKLKTKAPEDRKFKIALLGNASVGKTSLAARYCLNQAPGLHGPTVGGVYYKKQSTMRTGEVLTQSIWDTAGEQKYRSMASLYYRDAKVILLIFDLTDLCSFKQLDFWVDELDCRIQRQSVPVIVVGNKCDLQNREVSLQDIRNWLNRNQHCRYIECSASTGQGVMQVFNLASQCFLKWEEKQ